MNSKQLANVLIKIFGFSIFINGILNLITGVMQLIEIGSGGRGVPLSSVLMLPAHAIISMGISIYLMAKSRQIVGFLFRGESE